MSQFGAELHDLQHHAVAELVVPLVVQPASLRHILPVELMMVLQFALLLMLFLPSHFLGRREEEIVRKILEGKLSKS